MPSFEELKAQYPHLWEKTQKRLSHPDTQKKFFLGLVQIEKAKRLEKEIQAKERARDRRRRTRALILFALRVLENSVRDGQVERIREDLQRRPLKGREGRREVDYTPYVLGVLDDLSRSGHRSGHDDDPIVV